MCARGKEFAFYCQSYYMSDSFFYCFVAYDALLTLLLCATALYQRHLSAVQLQKDVAE